MGADELLGEGKTEPFELPHRTWGAQGPALVWPCPCLWSGICTVTCCCGLRFASAASDEGWEAPPSSSERASEGTKGWFIGPGLLIQWLPWCGHLLREVFYLCQKRGEKGCPTVHRLQNRFPSPKLWGWWGAALVAFFFHESGGGLA